MDSGFSGPVNIGSDEMVSIDQLACLVMTIAGKELKLRHITGPLGVRGRNSDNRLIERELQWRPHLPLRQGLEVTYSWIQQQILTTSSVALAADSKTAAVSHTTA